MALLLLQCLLQPGGKVADVIFAAVAVAVALAPALVVALVVAVATAAAAAVVENQQSCGKEQATISRERETIWNSTA